MANTIVDVLREICIRGCSARVDLQKMRQSPYYLVMAVAPNGGSLACVTADPDAFLVQEDAFRYFVADLDDPKAWASVNEKMPARVA